jgi:hypothetical protein
MSQEITVIVLVDVQAAIKNKSLEGNIYLMDNLRTDGSEGEGTEKLITAVDGSHWSDGSQNCDIVMNWLITGISSLPVTLPRSYYKTRAKHIEQQWVQSIKDFHLSKTTRGKSTNLDKSIIEKIGTSSLLKIAPGHTVNTGIKPLNIFGQHFDNQDSNNDLSHLIPQISDITGEAVINKVLFPAQYGTPIAIKNGWYWSATVDTSKTGVYNYILHITLYDYVDQVWVPIEMTHSAKVKISNNPVKNGFTNAGLGLIPLIY